MMPIVDTYQFSTFARGMCVTSWWPKPLIEVYTSILIAPHDDHSNATSLAPSCISDNLGPKSWGVVLARLCRARRERVFTVEEPAQVTLVEKWSYRSRYNTHSPEGFNDGVRRGCYSGITGI